MTLNDYEQSEDNLRFWYLSNGNCLRATKSDPYGFWKLSLQQGQMDSAYAGDYSMWTELLEAITKYLNERNLTILPEPFVPPKLERKPVKEVK